MSDTVKNDTKDKIRRDLFSVQERGNGHDEWCHKFICRTKKTAVRLRSTLGPILGFSYNTRIVHPTQFAVDAFLTVGNEIQD